MRITKHNHLYQLTFFPKIFPVNCYLIEEENELTLIDAALSFSYKHILEAAKNIKKPITKIVLTHAHGDHIGSLDALKENLPDAIVYISERDARILQGDHSILKEEEPHKLRGGLPKNICTKPDILLKDGDSVGSLICVSMPGHTPGSMAFLDRRDHSFIAGDAFQIKGGLAVSGQWKIVFPFPAMATWNKEAALKSAEKVLACDISLLAVGHGDLLKNPQNQLKKLLSK
ncbi:MBL fold metallo-hydrolase [Niallia sp. NCCP-28]|uniref:MBL fold metallo-hydrolase n=1 Tax=Niallia sp. NCCP-28 TaxID=2934712 RepID=UPI002086520E|nr:MBL fold metallo-hydrolase [Niallia sp. NCCP-28]GKU83551.1 MBL fold metallo-hydrolase [Niallia sp. NCCP-28]